MSTPISRRSMLTKTIGAGVMAIATAEILSCRYNDAILAHPVWLAGGFDASAIRALGERYRVEHPKEATLAALSAQLDAAANGRWPWSPKRDLTEVVAQEFADDRTVLVDGWVLSRTEARLCAAVALMAERPAQDATPGQR